MFEKQSEKNYKQIIVQYLSNTAACEVSICATRRVLINYMNSYNVVVGSMEFILRTQHMKIHDTYT